MRTTDVTPTIPTEHDPASPVAGNTLPIGPGADLSWAHTRDVVLTVIGSAVILYLLAMLLEHFARIILIFVLSAVVAFTLEPVVGRVERRGVSRVAATVGAYVTFLAVLAGALFWV